MTTVTWLAVPTLPGSRVYLLIVPCPACRAMPWTACRNMRNQLVLAGYHVQRRKAAEVLRSLLDGAR